MYQPVQNDAVDEQLAEVLNRRDHCKILFSRIAPRRYLYGRLEVELSLPQSRFAQGPRASALELIVAVLGEGGAQRDVYSIGEFIRRYEDVEFDACEQQQDSEASSSPEKGDQHLVNNAGAEPSNAAVSRTGPIGGMNIPASSSIARPNFPVPPGSLLLRNSSSRPGLLGGSTSGLPQPGRIASGISLKQASLPASSGGGAGGLATQSSTGQASKSRLPKNHLLYSLQSPSECVASPSEQEPTIRRTTLPAGGSRPSCGVGSHAGSKASSIGSIQSGGSSSSVNTMWQQSKTIFATGTSNGAASVGQLSHPLGADPENKNSNNFDAFPTIRDGVLPSSTGDIFARERSRTTSFLPTASRSALSSPVFHLSPDPPRNNEPAIPANMKLRLPPRLQTPMLTGVAQLRNLSRPPPPVLAGAASPDPTRMLSSPTSGAGGSISPSMGLISAPRRIESPFQSNPARRAPSATRVAL
ncbi:unnamed protein product [Amoebophrya sp. A25]|nr:unnamed protein product [Amoebophrya sp. A25]|eukprot:GSA25T00001205001.1